MLLKDSAAATKEQDIITGLSDRYHMLGMSSHGIAIFRRVDALFPHVPAFDIWMHFCLSFFISHPVIDASFFIRHFRNFSLVLQFRPFLPGHGRYLIGILSSLSAHDVDELPPASSAALLCLDTCPSLYLDSSRLAFLTYSRTISSSVFFFSSCA